MPRMLPAGLKIDGFLAALIGVTTLAWLWPEYGATGGPLYIDWISSYGIAVVFFLYGLTLAPEKMRTGLVRWPVHIAVQLGTFALFPIVVLALSPLLRLVFPQDVVLGFFYLAALPGTVSSAVAMTSLARGNVPVAIFNASLSSLIGVVATPLLMAWYVSSTGGQFALGAVILKIMLLVLLPVMLGQLLHLPLLRFTERYRSIIKYADRLIILAIVYGSFSDSIQSGVWSAQDASSIIKMMAASIALFFLIYSLMKLVAHFAGFDREDRIAFLFCASKKSLATGVPLSHVIFGATPAIGLIIAPLMLYHFFQLLIVGVIANRMSREIPEQPQTKI